MRRDELERYAGSEVPDLVGPGVRLLVVGINPSLWSAATGAHFAHPGNRFMPALLEAGILTRSIERGRSWTADERDHLVERGIGITNLVARATARADELTADELEAGAHRLRRLVRGVRPRVVAIAGITAYRAAFGDRRATVGEQPGGLEGAALWVVPNPSGLNAHETVATLAAAYRDAATAAGIEVSGPAAGRSDAPGRDVVPD
jgi:TDG/mug DNA glycosylase family protein